MIYQLLIQLLILTMLICEASVASPSSSLGVDTRNPYRIVSVSDITASKYHRSHEQKELVLIQIPSKSPTIDRYYIQAGLHGNEGLTTTFALWLARRLIHGSSPLNQFSDAAFDILPIANPDGHARNERGNIEGVNLNRNFSVLWGKSREFPGAKSFSEPETKSIRELFRKTKYSAAIDVHGFINWIVLPSPPHMLPSAESVKDRLKKEQRYQELKRSVEYARQQSDASYVLKTAGELGDGGAFEDWAFWEAGVPAFCLEMDHALPPSPGIASSYAAFERYEQLMFHFIQAQRSASLVLRD